MLNLFAEVSISLLTRVPISKHLYNKPKNEKIRIVLQTGVFSFGTFSFKCNRNSANHPTAEIILYWRYISVKYFSDTDHQVLMNKILLKQIRSI